MATSTIRKQVFVVFFAENGHSPKLTELADDFLDFGPAFLQEWIDSKNLIACRPQMAVDDIAQVSAGPK